MQFNEWLISAHATALSTMRESEFADDSCLQCHSGDYRWTQAFTMLFDSGELEGDPPPAITLETAQFGVTCVNCHDPHAEDEQITLFSDDHYSLCTDCHTNPAEGDSIHHPVKEMFEGIALVSNVAGISSAHFSAEDGPRCVTCHMPQVPVEHAGTRASHNLNPIVPGEEENGPPDACSNCHEDLTATDLQSLVRDTQERVVERLSVAFARLSSVQQPEAGTPEQEHYDAIRAALTFVQNDASLGVHNYDYADSLLKMAEQGLSELSVPGAVLRSTEAPAPTATPSETVTTLVSTGGETVSRGIRPVTGLLIGLVVVILLIAARQFFRKSGEA
jgi:predicted CXXCH cytochrome family protein